MRQDQHERITALTESLTDVFIRDADPSKWPGAESPELTQQERGDRVWALKSANQVGALLMRTLELRDRIAGVLPPTMDGKDDDRAEANIAKYEKEARRLLDTIGGKRGGGAS